MPGDELGAHLRLHVHVGRDVEPEQLSGGVVAQHPHQRRVDRQKSPRGAGAEDPDGGVFDQRAVVRLGAAQRRLGPGALGDVERESYAARDSAVGGAQRPHLRLIRLSGPGHLELHDLAGEGAPVGRDGGEALVGRLEVIVKAPPDDLPGVEPEGLESGADRRCEQQVRVRGPSRVSLGVGGDHRYG